MTSYAHKRPASTGKVGPSDVNIEKALIAAILRDNAILDRVSHLTAEDFFDPFHASIYAAACGMRGANRNVSKAALAVELGESTLPDGKSAREYLLALGTGGSDANPVDLADAIKALSTRREIAELCREASDMCGDSGKPADIVDHVMARIMTIATSFSSGPKVEYTQSEAMDSLNTHLTQDHSKYQLKTGFATVDEHIGGLRRGETSVLGAQSGMGKSLMAVTLARNVAKSTGLGVIVFTQEMSEIQWAARHVATASYSPTYSMENIHYATLLRGAMQDRHKEKLQTTMEAERNLSITYITLDGLRVRDVAARVRRVMDANRKAGIDTALVIIDHLHRMNGEHDYKGNDTAKLTEITKGLNNVAKSANVHMHVLAQLSRAPNGRENKRPVKSDLRQSGSIEQDADLILMLYRPAAFLQTPEDEHGAEQQRLADLKQCEHVMEVLITKNRGGPEAEVELYCDLACNLVLDQDKKKPGGGGPRRSDDPGEVPY